MAKGYLAFILHAHLPFVRHPETRDVMEERWLFEAITECYLPLLSRFTRMAEEGHPFVLTMSVSPTLAGMLADPLLQSRYLEHLDSLLRLADSEVERLKDNPNFLPVAKMYRRRLEESRDYYLNRWGCNLLGAFRQLSERGHLELMTCGATHGILPLMVSKEAWRAQVRVAVESHKAHFGQAPRGIWLPECGYTPGVEQVLKEEGLEYFVNDTQGFLHSYPSPPYGVYAPLQVGEVAAFGRDLETSQQVWDKQSGYPGDYVYREYYRDIGFDLPEEYIGPWLHQGIRLNTGFKYYRITGQTAHKEPYHPGWADEKAAEHAGNFVFNRTAQIRYLAGKQPAPPIVVSPYDAELFGHWWFEGPQFLEYVLKKTAYDAADVDLITPGRYLDRHGMPQKAQPHLSTWGHEGYLEVWLNPANDWIYRHLHQAEERMIDLATFHTKPDALTRRALNQMARELLLAQASDWAFIMWTGTTVPYAVRRTREHLERFFQLEKAVREKAIDEGWLSGIEWRDNIFPHIDYKVYGQKAIREPKLHLPVPAERWRMARPEGGRRVLMLAWEYPPRIQGGLARAVADLAESLVKLGEEVHVITLGHPGSPAREEMNGVHVYRVDVPGGQGPDFLHWVSLFNLAMVEEGIALMGETGPFDVVHGHDWLVALASKTLRRLMGAPLVVTIHATEFGRNHGLHNDMSHYIHGVEANLVEEADRVIACSRYMADEIKHLFNVPDGKLKVIVNGVNPQNLAADPALTSRKREDFAGPHENIIFYVGRLVQEKGVQTLIQAMPKILARFPNTVLVVAGRGPMMDELKRQAWEIGVFHRVHFAGFVDDATRNMLFQWAQVAVFPSYYEPFGIVALEAMAAQAPLVVSDTGGMSEIIRHGENGMKAYPNNLQSLADAIIPLLADPAWARSLADKAYQEVLEHYDWHGIALSTMELYQEVGHGNIGRVRGGRILQGA